MKKVYLAAMCAALTVGGAGLHADDGDKAQPVNAGQMAAAASASDVAFDRYVDLSVLATAWDSLNSELLTDVALQMLEGERVLRRSHHAISADQLLSTAVKVAVEKQDTASLARLAKATEESGRQKLTEEIRIAEKLLANSRGDGRAKDAAAEMSADQLEMQRSVLAEIRRAKLVGDPDTLNAIEKDLAAASALTEPQRKQLLQQINEAKSSTSPADASQQAARETLEKLSGESRQWNVPYPPYYPPYYPRNTQI
ncbi:MAG: hypothetical protein ACO1RT_05605 [Planctomycetaceae bacterium]